MMIKVSASKDGVVYINSSGTITVDDVKLSEIIAEKLGINLDYNPFSQFAGSVTITVCDLTIPLIVDVEED